MTQAQILETVIAALYALVLGIGTYAYTQDKKRLEQRLDDIDKDMKLMIASLQDHAQKLVRAEEHRAQFEEWRQDIREDISELRDQMAEANRKLDRLLGRLGVSTPQEFSSPHKRGE